MFVLQQRLVTMAVFILCCGPRAPGRATGLNVPATSEPPQPSATSASAEVWILDSAPDLRSLPTELRERVLALGLSGDWMFIASRRQLNNSTARAVTLQAGAERLEGYLVAAEHGTHALMTTALGTEQGEPNVVHQLYFSTQRQIIGNHGEPVSALLSERYIEAAAVFVGAEEDSSQHADERALTTPASDVLRSLRDAARAYGVVAWPIPAGRFELDSGLRWRVAPHSIAVEDSIDELFVEAAASGYDIVWRNGAAARQFDTTEVNGAPTPVWMHSIAWSDPGNASGLPIRLRLPTGCVKTPSGYACASWNPDEQDRLVFARFDSGFRALGRERTITRGAYIRAELAFDSATNGFALLWTNATEPSAATLRFQRLGGDGRTHGNAIVLYEALHASTLGATRLLRANDAWLVASLVDNALSIRTVDAQDRVSERTTLLDHIGYTFTGAFDVVWTGTRALGFVAEDSICRVSDGAREHRLPCPEYRQHGPYIVRGRDGVGVAWAEPGEQAFRIMFGELEP